MKNRPCNKSQEEGKNCIGKFHRIASVKVPDANIPPGPNSRPSVNS